MHDLLTPWAGCCLHPVFLLIGEGEGQSAPPLAHWKESPQSPPWQFPLKGQDNWLPQATNSIHMFYIDQAQINTALFYSPADLDGIAHTTNIEKTSIIHESFNSHMTNPENT